MPYREFPEPLTGAEAIWLARWVLERTYRAVKEARDWERLGVTKYEDFRLSPGGIEDGLTLRELLRVVVARCTSAGEERRGRHVVTRFDVALVVARRNLARALKRELKGATPSPEALQARWAAIEGTGLDVPPDREHWLRSHERPTYTGADGPDLQATKLLSRLFGPGRRKQDAAKASVRARVGPGLAATASVQQILDAQGGPDPATVATLVDFALRDVLAEPHIAMEVAARAETSDRQAAMYEPVSPVPPPPPPEYDPAAEE